VSTPAGEAAPTGRPGDEVERSRRPLWQELPVLIIIAFAIALVVKTFALQAFYIPSVSMDPTLEVGDRVLVEKIGYRIGSPARGDIVVFQRDLQEPEPPRSVWTRVGDAFRELFGFPTSGRENLIKRVVAVGGEEIEGRNGRVYVDGEPLEEPWLANGEVSTFDFPVTTIPEGMIFVMGDNRDESGDSRSFGPISEDRVVGKAFFSVWPLSHAGAI
jgi:signal peptidase I